MEGGGLRVGAAAALDPQVGLAAQESADYIKGEVLALTFVSDDATQTEADIDGMRFTFGLRKADQ